MDTDAYFDKLKDEFYKLYNIANSARSKGFDPEKEVEIKPAPDLAARVEGIIGVKGIGELIKERLNKITSRTALAFDIVKEICIGDKFKDKKEIERIDLAVKTALAIVTEGILVAPTEGIQTVKMFYNEDNTPYVAILYAGPIRSAGGTAVALSVAFADYARRFFNIDRYKPSEKEIERYVEEIELYHTRVARLQYRPSDDEIRHIVKNCPVCVDGVPTEDLELSTYRNIKRKNIEGKEEMITNRIRGGVPLVLCEGIAQKAKKLTKELKYVNLDWNWLEPLYNKKIVEEKKEDVDTNFLSELVGGRPILAYPNRIGGFRLRYGRSRFTGLAAMGFNPATMLILEGFMAVGTQLKMSQPRKGTISMPVDSIEGPFVVLDNGDALRINNAKDAKSLQNKVKKIISLGDILISYGDFKHANTPLLPTSYVEEFWESEVKSKLNKEINASDIDFISAFNLSKELNIPLPPKFIYEFQALKKDEIIYLINFFIPTIERYKEVNEINDFAINKDDNVKNILELLCVPHKIRENKIIIERDYFLALLTELGFINKDLSIKIPEYNEISTDDPLELINKVSIFKVPRRSTFIGARIGRPEKAKERLMKPAPHALFPIGETRDRDIAKLYQLSKKQFGRLKVSVEIANYYCPSCKRLIEGPYCYSCNTSAILQYTCPKCGNKTFKEICELCGTKTVPYQEREIDIEDIIEKAMSNLEIKNIPNQLKGVKGLTNKNKEAEPIEKGILRSKYNVYVFKDGTCRFDSTDAPITHFYPKEIHVSVEKLREMGYDKDYLGNELVSDEQLVELKHQDIIINTKGLEYLYKVANFIDELLVRFYKMEPFYNLKKPEDLIGHLVITLSPHTSCGVLSRIIGYTDARVGLAHPYLIAARRRNCDGDEDSAMLLLDALLNFSRHYLSSTIGGTMDAPIVLSLNIYPEEVDDEAHDIEVVDQLPLEFYYKSYENAMPSDIPIETVKDRLTKNSNKYENLMFSIKASSKSIDDSPKKSLYVTLNTMEDKIKAEFELMEKIYAIDKKDAASRLIVSHFLPDMIGNLHSFSKQIFRCSVCNRKYRRIPLSGKCEYDNGNLLLTISRGSIEKYLDNALNLAYKYDVDDYIKERLNLIKEEIKNMFDLTVNEEKSVGQFDLSKFV